MTVRLVSVAGPRCVDVEVWGLLVPDSNLVLMPYVEWQVTIGARGSNRSKFDCVGVRLGSSMSSGVLNVCCVRRCLGSDNYSLRAGLGVFVVWGGWSFFWSFISLFFDRLSLLLCGNIVVWAAQRIETSFWGTSQLLREPFRFEIIRIHRSSMKLNLWLKVLSKLVNKL
jgi:hypothetical protein